MKYFFSTIVVILSCCIFASCNDSSEIPFPTSLSEFPQPEAKPLELTDTKPLRWDTVSRKAITPKVFPLDFSRLPEFTIQLPL